MKTNYVIVELQESYSSDALIAELAFYGASSEPIYYNLSNTLVYDDSGKGIPIYWNSTFWDKSKLKDGRKILGSDSASCLMNDGEGGVTTPTFTRFLVDFGKYVELDSCAIWVGSSGNFQGRQPKKVNVYKSDLSLSEASKFFTEERIMEDLELVGAVENPLYTKITEVKIEFYKKQNKYLFSQNNTAYTIENNTLKSLGTITTANASTLFKSGVEAITKEHCVLAGQQLGKAKIMRMSV